MRSWKEERDKHKNTMRHGDEQMKAKLQIVICRKEKQDAEDSRVIFRQSTRFLRRADALRAVVPQQGKMGSIYAVASHGTEQHLPLELLLLLTDPTQPQEQGSCNLLCNTQPVHRAAYYKTITSDFKIQY